ncbi:4-(cytidine 5'-diphospho)-2-C-methyl-D-erythritol kinase [bacterium]|nr:4-(cytidine 5'-diphospho)-2-C-methyl-D-erythritol kinase [bacterium]
MTGPQALYLPSRAKLNLVLRILGRRDDGYHLLESLFHTLDLHDDVVVEYDSKGSGIGITVTADHERLLVPDDERNLAVKALVALRQELGLSAIGGFHIRLHKRIPNGGGLGGGSSNAAAVLRLANAILAKDSADSSSPREALGDPQLAAIGAQLGADVPFFLRGGTQWGRGIGTDLTETNNLSGHFVLLLPAYGCGTVKVYKKHASTWSPAMQVGSIATISVPSILHAALGNRLFNDLESAAERIRPQLGRLRQAVEKAGYSHVRMSGSGSTLFIVAADLAAADHCQRHLAVELAETEHRDVEFVVASSGPAIDFDQPSSRLPKSLWGRPRDPMS